MANKKNTTPEFDFGTTKKEDETPVVNSAESTESIDSDETKTQADQPELTNNASDDSEDDKETEAKASNGAKAVVTYIGNGVWRDSEGKCWSRNERKDVDILATRSYDLDEYNKRDDLKFMVTYGEMKLTVA